MLKLLQSNFYRLFLLAMLCLGVNTSSWGQYSGTGTFTQITSLTDLTDGYYVIAYGTSMAMNNTNTGSYFGNTSISVSGGSINNPSTAIVWKIATSGSNKTIYNEASAKYVGYENTSNAAYADDAITGNKDYWTFTYTSSLFRIQSVNVSGRYLQYNSSSPRFACYAGTQQHITLYKLNNAAPTASNVTVTAADYNVGTTLTGNYTYADAESNPQGTSTYKWYTANDNAGTGAAAISGATASTFTLTSTQANKYIRFSVVPVASAGTTTGTETFSGWYGPVVNSNPTLTASPTSLSGFNYINNNGPSASQSFGLSGINLTGAPGTITVTAPADYVVSSDNTNFGTTASISYTAATLSSTNVYVKLKAGLAAGTYNGQTVGISGGSATASVTVNGSVTNQAPTASNVAVSGANFIVGTQLTGSYTYADYESNPEGTSTYKWYTATDNTGTSAAAISGATASTFTLTSTQAGKYIRYSVVPVATAGTTTGVETFSAWYGPVLAPSLAISGSTTAHGSVCVNAAGTPVTYTITNNGTAAATGVSVGTSNSMFAVSGLSSTTIAIGGTATYVVTFTPTSSGAKTATITVSATSANSATSSLTGTGVAISAPTVTTGTVTGITSSAATVPGTASVTSCSTAISAYGIYYSTTSGFANGSGTQVLGSNLTAGAYSVSLTGLNANTTYYYKGFATNESGTTYTSQGSFTTACGIVNLPFSENFEATTFVPGCWTKFRGTNNAGTSNDWVRTTTDTYNSSAGSAFVNWENVGQTTEDWLVTPQLSIPASDNNVELSFYEKQSLTAVYNSQYSIRISTTSQTSIASFATILSYDEQSFSTEYSLRTIDLSAYKGQNIYIALVMTQDDGDAWYVDNFSVKETTAAPVATTATNISTSGFTANWNNMANATSYQVDVATTATFGTTVLSENFSGYSSTNNGTNISDLGSTQTTGWTGTNIFGTGFGYVRIGAGSTTGNITTPTINLSANGGASTLSFKMTRYSSSETGTYVQVFYAADGTNYVQLGSNVLATADWQTLSYNITGGTANSKIRIQSATGFSTSRFFIDDILINYSTILSSYNGVTANTNLLDASGLQENTTYYYRVRAISSLGASNNSNVIAVTTGRALIWNGTTWTYGAATGITPTVADSGTIAGSYNTTANGNLTIGSLTVQNGQSVTVASNTTLTVANAITNNGSFTVQNNGALVQTNEAANSGNIVVLKNSNALYRLDYTMWSSPVTGTQTLQEFSPATAVGRYYDYDTTESLYIPQTAATTTFGLAKGYLIRMPNVITANVAGTTNGGVTTQSEYEAGTGDYIYPGTFVGVPNNGTITKTLGTTGNRYTATGNPYPSPISVVDFFNENSDVLQAGTGIYFWRKRNNAATSSYATVTATSYTFNNQNGTTATGGGVNSEFFNMTAANWRIAPGQGFIVQASSTALNPELKFTNAMRRSALTGGVSFFKQTEVMTDLSRYWLDLSNESGTTSQMSVAYLAGATTGIDYSYDAFSFINEAYMSIYSLAADKKLNVQTRPSFEDTDVVPAGFNIPEAGTYTLTLANKDGVFESGQKIYLKDNQEGIIHNMDNPYTFTTGTGVYNNRFEIIYTTTTLGTDNPVANNNVMVFKDKNAVTISAGNTLINSVEVYDTRGRKLYAESNINTTNFSTNKLTVENQVIIVKVNTTAGTVSKKIIF